MHGTLFFCADQPARGRIDAASMKTAPYRCDFCSLNQP